MNVHTHETINAEIDGIAYDLQSVIAMARDNEAHAIAHDAPDMAADDATQIRRLVSICTLLLLAKR